MRTASVAGRPAPGGIFVRRAPMRAPTQVARLLVVLVMPLLLLAPPAAQAAELSLVGVTAPGPRPAPDYPVPDEAGMVLYMQRSMNPNTVIYAARFGADGMLERKRPLDAYWRRYNTDGDRKDLSFLERQMAYGVTTTRRAPGVYDVSFRAIPNIALVLEQRGPGQAMLSFAPKGEWIDLTYGYLEIDESGLIPDVTGIMLFGQRRADGRPVQVTYSVDGGRITLHRAGR